MQIFFVKSDNIPPGIYTLLPDARSCLDGRSDLEIDEEGNFWQSTYPWHWMQDRMKIVKVFEDQQGGKFVGEINFRNWLFTPTGFMAKVDPEPIDSFLGEDDVLVLTPVPW